ncbi:uncharacterized protein LOC109848420 isoform X1 [Asparagus officinalis]|nr:uncharacterized protein LOC109848420 isoform X1 [Asparagus officinalis]XP_020273485.1 uncharacterized protein LOC109848420 isoform X1 [Asparagus officinalis]
MPPEPLPWDRKDFVFKDRKHDRIASNDALSGGNSTSRWRDPYHFPRASPRRPPPSYHRQNGSYYQLYDESNGHGCTPSRSDDGYRSSNGRYNGGRSSSRESRGSFRRSPYFDGYEPSHVTSQRSVAVPITSPPPLQSRDLHGGGDDQRSDRDRDRDRYRDKDNSLGSIDWKPLKWSRQSSISSSKSIRSDVEEAVNGSLEVSVPNLGKETPVRSPVSSPAPLEDGVPKKKPRLTWGQGLAKYEKQKVEGSSNSGKDQVSESSLRVMGIAGSTSPATPCSAACPSPGTENMPFSKVTNIDNDTDNHSQTSVVGLQNHWEELLTKLDELPPISTLASLLNDMLQPEDACTGDSSSNRNNCANKLPLFKADISKELERTECEIDSLENELKSFDRMERVILPVKITLAIKVDSSSLPCQQSDDGSVQVSSNSTPVNPSETAAVEEVLLPICSSGEPEIEAKWSHKDILRTASHNNSESTSSGDGGGMSLDFEERTVKENSSEHFSHLDAASSNANLDLNVGSNEKVENNLVALIMASNREAAKKCSHVFDAALCMAWQQSDIWGPDRMLSFRKNAMQVREKLALRKHQIKFKERILTLKFRAFHHLWKEDLRLLSVRKQRPKSQKRFELCSRSAQSSSQKHRSSIRSRFTLPAGNLTLVPTADIVDFTSRLLSDSLAKLHRQNLKMPALILDEKERSFSRFITKNNLIEDPLSFEKQRLMINPWTQEEKGVFMDMLATYGKDFAKISSFLTHKTTADCIEFYYKNHKSESFREVKKQLNLRKQRQCLSTNMYMVTSGKKWNRESNAASLDMLGTVSVAVAHNSSSGRSQQKYTGRSVIPSYHGSKVSRGTYHHHSFERPGKAEISRHEKEIAGIDVLAGYGSLSSEAVSSCVTSSVSPPEKMSSVIMDMPVTPEFTQAIEEEDTCSDEGCAGDSLDWIDEEKSIFIRALSSYGKDFAKISQCVGTKSRDQCRIFFSKARKCLSLDQIHPGSGNGGTPVSDANGRSDTDDACAAELDSAICSTQSCSRMDPDFMQSVTNTGVEGIIHDGNISSKAETDRSCKYGAGGFNQEEADGKVDRLESVPRVEEVEIEIKNLQSKVMEGIGDAVVKHGELVPSHDDAESGRGVGKVENDTSSSFSEDEKMKIQTTDEVQQGVISKLKSEVELQQVPMMSETVSGERQEKKVDTYNSSSVNFSFSVESTVKETDSYTASKSKVGPNRTFNFSTHEQSMPLDLLSQKRSQLLSAKERSYSAPLSTVMPEPSSIWSDGSFRVQSHSTLDFNDHVLKPHQGSASKDLCQQRQSRINLNQVHQSSHVLSGYPVQALNQKDSKREAIISSGKQTMHEGHLNRSLSSQLCRHFVPDIQNEKREGSVPSRPGVLFFDSKEDKSDSQLRPCSINPSQETEEQSTHRTGDVKLFGQILTNPHSHQKSNSSSQDIDSQPPSQKQKKPATVTISTSRTSSSSLFPPKAESISQSSLQEVPLQSYGYWDGSRIQTGFSSLPEQAVMLAAYQGSSAGTPFYPPAKDIGVASSSGAASANGAAKNYQQAYGQPEMQKRSRFELVSGFQQGGRPALARLGINGGSRSVLVGSNGVSDPVAALKIAKLYTGEVESWTRDVNSR